MHQGKLVFAQIMELLPRHKLDACVQRYDGNRRARGFSYRNQFLCLAYGQLTFRKSLRRGMAQMLPLDERDLISRRIVSDFVHERPHQQQAAPMRKVDVRFHCGIGNRRNVKTGSFISDRHRYLIGREFGNQFDSALAVRLLSQAKFDEFFE